MELTARAEAFRTQGYYLAQQLVPRNLVESVKSGLDRLVGQQLVRLGIEPVPGATVLTHYRALGDVAQGRQYLLSSSWAHWRDIVLADLTRAHPDIVSKTTRIDVTRYGHAMAIPAPQTLASTLARASGVLSQGSLRFAHSDWAGYSVFEEAFTLGHEAAQI